MVRYKILKNKEKLSQKFCLYLCKGKSILKLIQHWKSGTFSGYFDNYIIWNCISWTINGLNYYKIINGKGKKMLL